MFKNILVLLILVLLASCSQPTKTEAQLKVSFGALAAAAPPGGVMIYGHNLAKTAVFGQQITSGNSHTFPLDPGDWIFYAIGWDGATPMQGTVRCGHTTATLSGASVSVNLNINTANCTNDKFTDPDFVFSGVPQDLKVYTCNDLTGLNASSDCDTPLGGHGSIEIVLPDYMSPDSSTLTNTSFLKTTCVTIGPSPLSLAPVNIALPLGGTEFSFNTEIHAYSTTNCTGTKEIFKFPDGISQGVASGDVNIIDGSTDDTRVFLLATIGPTVPPAPTGLAMTGLSPKNDNSATVDVSGVVPGSTITVYSDSSCTTAVSSPTAYTADPTNINVTLSGPNTYTLYADQTVGALTSTCSTASATHIVDTTVPTGASALAWSATPTNGTTATLSWTAGSDVETGINAYQVELFNNATCTAPNIISTGLANNITSYTFINLNIDGAYYAKITTTDNANNSVSDCFATSVEIDNVAPGVATGLNWTQTTPTNLTTIQSNWTPAGDAFTQFFHFYNDGTCSGVPTTSEMTFNDTFVSQSAMTDNIYSFKVDTQDAAGNSTMSGCSTALEIDTVAPTAPTSITLTSPVSSPSNSSSATFDVAGITVGFGVQLFSDASCLTSASTFITSTGNPETIGVSGLGEGIYTYYAKQKDLAGNWSTCSGVNASYEMDSTPPLQPTLIGVFGGSDLIADATLDSGHVVSVDWSNQADEDKYLVSIYDSTNSTNKCVEETIDQDILTHEFSSCPLDVGLSYYVRLAAKDAAGNPSTYASFMFTVNAPIWSTVAQSPAVSRMNHTTVWTGTEMIIYGGSSSGTPIAGGSRYLPGSVWTTLNTTSAPLARIGHSAVWTGTQMVVWGGENAGTFYQDGKKFTPNTPGTGGSWGSIENYPTGGSGAYQRSHHLAVWDASGNRMIIWGGYYDNTGITYRNDGIEWTPDGSLGNMIELPQSGTPPSPRSHMAYAIIGDYLVVWGGYDGSTYLDNGARFKLSENTWYPMTAPPIGFMGRNEMSFASTGDKLAIWSGYGGAGPGYLSDGALYDPVNDSWTSMSTVGAPAARQTAGMLWTENELMVWGGVNGGGALNDGGFYNPVTDSWSLVLDGTPPSARYHNSMIFDTNSKEVYIFGGTADESTSFIDLFKIKP